MSENLKVNTNTTILEFKRKHNLLVNEVMSEDKEILGDLTIGGELYMQGDATIEGDLKVTGNANLPIINDEQNPSVKPIYCHPITIWDGLGSGLILSCMIFNNSPTQLNLSQFISLLQTWSGRLICNGSIVYNNKIFDLKYIIVSGTDLIMQGSVEGVPQQNLDCPKLNELNLETASFNDSVNKIN